MTLPVLKSFYRSYEDNLRSDFFIPCMRSAKAYDRATGYFSSESLKTWAEALLSVNASSPFRVRLITSPQLSDEDTATISALSTNDERAELAQRWGDSLFTDLIKNAAKASPRGGATALLCWLLINDWLALRIAIPRHGRGLYHEKIGIFHFEGGGRIAFIGSANETGMGHDGNGEMLVLFRDDASSDVEKVSALQDAFDKTWNEQQQGLLIYRPSPELIPLLQTKAKEWTAFGQPISSPPVATSSPWPHQREAIDAFLKAKRGVLEMATGTGKTRTAMEIACELIRKGQIDGVIVSTDGNDLLRQWHEEILTWQHREKQWQRVYRDFHTDREAERFVSRPSKAVLVCARHNLHHTLRRLSSDAKRRILVIHDEIHGLGAPQKRQDLDGLHNEITYVLGLSATPEREYDAEGSAFITKEIGPIIYRFGLEEAIRAGILCELDYVALRFELTGDDKKRIEKVWSIKAARAREGNPMSDEEVAIYIANVYKTAELKPSILADYLSRNPALVKNTILFVASRAFGEEFLPILHSHTNLYRTYYADDDVENLRLFCDGKIECLITCHKLSQGIDIKKLETVVLVSSDRSRLETIQRIGRCLRKHPERPDKRALVVDMVCDGLSDDKNPDLSRFNWLSELSKVRRTAL